MLAVLNEIGDFQYGQAVPRGKFFEIRHACHLAVLVDSAPVLPVTDAEGQRMTTDEGIRESTIEKLATLKPSFKEDGKVTGVTMKPLSPLADFSYDFQHLAFVPVG